MIVAPLPQIGTVAAWRDAARRALTNRIEPEAIEWCWNCAPLTTSAEDLPPPARRAIRVPKEVLTLADTVIWHRDPARFDLAYRLLWQVSQDPKTLRGQTSPDHRRLLTMQSAVLRCQTRMTRTLRFARISISGSRPVFGAWYDPDHPILEPVARDMAPRLKDLIWTIATPGLCAQGRDGPVSFRSEASPPHWAQDLSAQAKPVRRPEHAQQGLFQGHLPKQRCPEKRR